MTLREDFESKLCQKTRKHWPSNPSEAVHIGTHFRKVALTHRQAGNSVGKGTVASELEC